ncbi:MAG: hypothetical protein ACK514_03600 [Bacteroidota bacterium]|jgi:hypothetical protein|nr:hypothetical protein [Cytophagales bacterium]MCE2956918.1 hypothetical protein [Flammeovirgaceae bacterium]MCZ8072222.1 hypothetical protein [Cytophagales bacterium]
MTSQNMRVYHRYLGFFLAGIMAIYAISGIVMIFRNTDFLKKEKIKTSTLPVETPLEEVGKTLRIRDFKITKTEGDLVYFQNGTYNTRTGEATLKVKELPTVLEKLTNMHKATTKSPLFVLNIFFGLSLLFFVVSAFWMFMPSSDIFKKGLYFTLAGIVLALIMVLV